MVRTEPRAEYLAAAELDRDGFEVLLPRLKLAYPRFGHTDMPLFPGYLFIRCSPETSGWPVFRPGHRVSGWVSFGGEVPSMSDEAVDEFLWRIEEANNKGGFWKRFELGERVEIVSKTMQGLAEVVQTGKSAQGRVKVLLNFMGRMVSADVPWEHLRSVPDQAKEPVRIPRRTRGRGRRIIGAPPSVPVPSVEAEKLPLQ